MTYTPTPVEVERRNRIRVAVFAYAYEFLAKTLISDHEYDALSRRIDPMVETGNDVMDDFFFLGFTPDTGMWIHQHPQLDGIRKIYERVYL